MVFLQVKAPLFFLKQFLHFFLKFFHNLRDDPYGGLDRDPYLIMKKYVILVLFKVNMCLGQMGYPVEEFFGGGIGYSPMYISLDSIPGSSRLTALGLRTQDFKDPFVIHGGEGFAHVTGKWRVGGYAGLGASSVSTVPDIMIYEENNSIPGYQSGVDGQPQDYTEFFSPTIEAKFTIALGAASVEYVMPLLQDLELSGGALLGFARANIAVDQQTGTPRWDNTFSNVYGVFDSSGTLYYGVDTIIDGVMPVIVPGPVPGILRDVSATFFNFQPYIAMKWQFLERVGLRISVGFNKGTIGNGSWSLNGRTKIGDSPTAAIQGVAFRTMLYIGL